jgi:hypothetical protein
MRTAARGLALLGAAFALATVTTAHAGPTAQVDFTPGTGHFEFSFDGVSEFTGSACTSCTLTEFSWADPFGHIWSSTGVGNGGVIDFDAVFDAQGTLQSWSFVLAPYAVACPAPYSSNEGCQGVKSTILSSTSAAIEAQFAWPDVSVEVCLPDENGEERCRMLTKKGSSIGSIGRPEGVFFSTTLDGVVPAPGTLALAPLALAVLAWTRRGRPMRAASRSAA